MLNKEKIEQAIAEVVETINIENWDHLNNWKRVFQRISGKTAFKYNIIDKIFKKVISSFKCPDSKEIIKKIKEDYNGLEYSSFDSDAVITENFIYTTGCVICSSEDSSRIIEELKKYFKQPAKFIPTIKYILITPSGGITIKRIEIKEVDSDISLNYNDDVPYERLKEIVNLNESSISILHGIPGSGKTFLLRRLIADNPEVTFFWVDSSMMRYMIQESFVDFLYDNPDTVWILEDCENLLKAREDCDTGLLASLLNMSDGMLGDALNIKFICTFNADLSRIDKALLRKGRLRLKYEFKELTKEKVKALADNLGIEIPEIKPMPLCDVYNYKEDNGSKSEKKRIGF